MPLVEVIKDCPNVGRVGARAKLTEPEANVLKLLGYVRYLDSAAPAPEPSPPAPAEPPVRPRKKRKRTYRRKDVEQAPERVVSEPAINLDSTDSTE